MENIKYIFAYIGWSERAIRWANILVDYYKSKGYNIEGYCLSPNPPQKRFNFKELDKLVRRKDKSLRKIFSGLKEICHEADILINFNGANIHPLWLKELKTFNVFISWDDPESSHLISEPVAKYFDFSFTGNASCVPLYQSWGIQRIEFLPLGLHPLEYDSKQTTDTIIKAEREIDVVFLGEKESAWRRERLNKFEKGVNKFNNLFAGNGWEHGWIDESKKIPLYTNSKIGINIHNSVGPVNLRTYTLPANGVLQIADNKSRLGSLFKLGEEAIGFNSIDEAVDLTHYYLNHDQERIEIALNGYNRVMKDYSPLNLLENIEKSTQTYRRAKLKNTLSTTRYEHTIVPSIAKKYFRIAKKILPELRKPHSNIKFINDFGNLDLDPDIVYNENNEEGPVNISEKQKRLDKGSFFEWPNIVALNWAVAKLIKEAKIIAEIGCGTGAFAFEVSADPTVEVLASDLDAQAIKWAKENRSRKNITYLNNNISPEQGPFDLVVSIEVIEHVKNFQQFIEYLVSLGNEVLITTPSKIRGSEPIEGPPKYYQHVREWSPGEFYWILKSYFEDVKLFSMKNQFVPMPIPVDISTNLTPIIAWCKNPLKK